MKTMACIGQAPLSATVWAMLWLTGSAQAGFPDEEPAGLARAKALIKGNAKEVIFFALTTYTYKDVGENSVNRLKNGYELIYTFEVDSAVRHNTVKMAFLFDTDGAFDHCRVVQHTTHYTPFKDAIGKKELKKQKEFMRDHPSVKGDRERLRTVEESGPKELLEFYFKLEQARPSSDQPRTKVQQVYPPHDPEAGFQRSPGQDRAVLMVHGLRVAADQPGPINLPVFSAWQQPDSMLVKKLGDDADVFAYAYGQAVSLREAWNAEGLKSNVAQLKQLGYAEIVLVGHSAGGVVVRHFIEDNPNCGVTKVIQVCSPNLGTPWAYLSRLAAPNQHAFVEALTDQARRQCLLERRKVTIPAEVQFVCVVSNICARGDLLVSCRSQWSEDLQEQGIPAYSTGVPHCALVTELEGIKLLRDLIRTPQPRWTAAKVKLERNAILKD